MDFLDNTRATCAITTKANSSALTGAENYKVIFQQMVANRFGVQRAQFEPKRPRRT